jgi:hypothetical protein
MITYFDRINDRTPLPCQWLILFVALQQQKLYMQQHGNIAEQGFSKEKLE